MRRSHVLLFITSLRLWLFKTVSVSYRCRMPKEKIHRCPVMRRTLPGHQQKPWSGWLAWTSNYNNSSIYIFLSMSLCFFFFFLFFLLRSQSPLKKYHTNEKKVIFLYFVNQKVISTQLYQSHVYKPIFGFWSYSNNIQQSNDRINLYWTYFNWAVCSKIATLKTNNCLRKPIFQQVTYINFGGKISS